MSTMKSFPLYPNADLNAIAQIAARNLTSQGFGCQVQMMGPQAAMITVSKDRDGFKNIIGMGLECRVNISIMGNQIAANIDSEWTNKIIAIAVGWFVCLIPFITGLVGAVNQSGLPEKISTAIQMAIAEAQNGGAVPPQAPYQQFPQQ